MPQLTNDAFRDEKNKGENRPVMLYEVYVPGSTIYLAEYDQDVVYPTTGGQTYLNSPIRHEGIATNRSGEIDAIKIHASNVSREMGALLLQNNGLKGVKVTLKLVFADLLDDADANLSWTYYIDASEITENEANFIATSKLDFYEVELPARRFMRDHCPWQYKKEGCWLKSGGVWVAPSGFTNEAAQCDKTRKGPAGCEFHNNQLRFGGFPAIPSTGIYVI